MYLRIIPITTAFLAGITSVTAFSDEEAKFLPLNTRVTESTSGSVASKLTEDILMAMELPAVLRFNTDTMTMGHLVSGRRVPLEIWHDRPGAVGYDPRSEQLVLKTIAGSVAARDYDRNEVETIVIGKAIPAAIRGSLVPFMFLEGVEVHPTRDKDMIIIMVHNVERTNAYLASIKSTLTLETEETRDATLRERLSPLFRPLTALFNDLIQEGSGRDTQKLEQLLRRLRNLFWRIAPGVPTELSENDALFYVQERDIYLSTQYLEYLLYKQVPSELDPQNLLNGLISALQIMIAVEIYQLGQDAEKKKDLLYRAHQFVSEFPSFVLSLIECEAALEGFRGSSDGTAGWD